eukprot:scaffold4269_cov75-Phaeocystis_antarctica.AAC.2
MRSELRGRAHCGATRSPWGSRVDGPLCHGRVSCCCCAVTCILRAELTRVSFLPVFPLMFTPKA